MAAPVHQLLSRPQGTVRPRLVDALARLEMAREKAGITGRKPALPSALERAAQVWKAEQEPQERLLLQPGAEASALGLQRVALQARPNGLRTDGELAWRRQSWGAGVPPRRVVVMNAAMVSRIAQHLRAREWARAMGRKGSASPGPDLETWAEAQSRNQQLDPRGMPGQRRES